MIVSPFQLFCVVGSALAISACAQHRLIVPEPVPATDYYARTTHAFAWGLVEPRTVATECRSNVLDEVRVVTSLPLAIASVATLGIWMPSRVEYKCGKRGVEEGSLESGAIAPAREN